MKKLYVCMFVVVMVGILLLPGCAKLQETLNGSPASTGMRNRRPGT